MAARRTESDPVLATNRKAFHDYQVIERLEAGIQLVGTEVKSCRARAVQMGEAYCRVLDGQLWLFNLQIAPYAQGNRFNHRPKGMRRLLLHAAEIRKLAQLVGEKGGTIIPLKMYLKTGLIKLEIAYCRGKTHGDKRESLRKKQDQLETRRALRR